MDCYCIFVFVWNLFHKSTGILFLFKRGDYYSGEQVYPPQAHYMPPPQFMHQHLPPQQNLHNVNNQTTQRNTQKKEGLAGNTKNLYSFNQPIIFSDSKLFRPAESYSRDRQKKISSVCLRFLFLSCSSNRTLPAGVNLKKICFFEKI